MFVFNNKYEVRSRTLFLVGWTIYYIKIILFSLIVIVSTNTLSLEITVYIPIYEPLSKTISTSILGSSNIIIDRKYLEKYENTPIPDIIGLESGIKSRSIYGSNSSGSKSTLDIRGMGAQAKSSEKVARSFTRSLHEVIF